MTFLYYNANETYELIRKQNQTTCEARTENHGSLPLLRQPGYLHIMIHKNRGLNL